VGANGWTQATTAPRSGCRSAVLGRVSVATRRRALAGSLAVAFAATLVACSSGGGLDTAVLQRSITHQAQVTYPTLGVASTRCRAPGNSNQAFVCTARATAGTLTVRVQPTRHSMLSLDAVDAVLPPNSVAQFVAAHTSIPATVTCGTTGVVVAAPGTGIPCQLSFSDQTTTSVQVHVLDAFGNLRLDTATTAPAPAAPGGGLSWAPTGRVVLGRPVTFTAQSSGVGLAWLDPVLLHPVLVAGTSDPPGSPGPWGGQVAATARPALAAAFNSGFKTGDIRGGWVGWGTTWRPPVAGDASLVVNAAGQALLGQFGRDVSTGPDTAFVRQNLPLLVDGGAPVPSASSPGSWGASVGGASTWRSGLGIDAHGALIYAAGGGLTPAVLAQALVAGGAQRAMELDINPMWVAFNTYQPTLDGSVHGTKVFGLHNDDKYLSPDSRDFIAMLVRGVAEAGATGRVGADPLHLIVKTPTN
jgi:hypothetical protein